MTRIRGVLMEPVRDDKKERAFTFDEWWSAYPKPGGEDYVAAKAAWDAAITCLGTPSAGVSNIPCPRCGVNEGEKCRDFNDAAQRCNTQSATTSIKLHHDFDLERISLALVQAVDEEFALNEKLRVAYASDKEYRLATIAAVNRRVLKGWIELVIKPLLLKHAAADSDMAATCALDGCYELRRSDRREP